MLEFGCASEFGIASLASEFGIASLASEFAASPLRIVAEI